MKYGFNEKAFALSGLPKVKPRVPAPELPVFTPEEPVEVAPEPPAGAPAPVEAVVESPDRCPWPLPNLPRVRAPSRLHPKSPPPPKPDDWRVVPSYVRKFGPDAPPRTEPRERVPYSKPMPTPAGYVPPDQVEAAARAALKAPRVPYTEYVKAAKAKPAKIAIADDF